MLNRTFNTINLIQNQQEQKRELGFCSRAILWKLSNNDVAVPRPLRTLKAYFYYVWLTYD